MWWFAREGWMLAFGLLSTVVFWGAIIALVVWGVRTLADSQRRRAGLRDPEDPVAIAERRYARGEISREELQEIRHTLGR